MRITIEYRKLQAGDVLLDCTGQPMLTVHRLEQARARGYVVVLGKAAPGRSAQFPNGQASAYGRHAVTVERG